MSQFDLTWHGLPPEGCPDIVDGSLYHSHAGVEGLAASVWSDDDIGKGEEGMVTWEGLRGCDIQSCSSNSPTSKSFQ